MIETLKPVVIKPARIVTPQCSAVIPADSRFEQWRKGRYSRLRPHMNAECCQRESIVQIDGKPYCRLHAGGMALEKWLSGELVTKSDISNAAP